jgi:hypothetical protein
MSYTPQVWVDKVTDLDVPHMTHIEDGIFAALPKSAGAADPITGTLYFGADTTLYRSAAGTLNTDGYLNVGYDVKARGGSAYQVIVGYWAGFPAIQFGATPDTFLYRSAAGQLKTDQHFLAGASVQVDKSGAGNALYFGSANDTNLYRAGAGRGQRLRRQFARVPGTSSAPTAGAS